jgi:hypothetical protein
MTLPLPKHFGPKDKVFSDEEEQELCIYILAMESRLYGLTLKDLKGLAYRLAVKNNKPHPFNNEKQEKIGHKIFSKDILNCLLDSLKVLQQLVLQDLINRLWIIFFNFLGNLYDEHKMTPDRIYNCDETSISIVPKTKSKIIAKRGRKQVGTITSAERGTTITVEICFSASGQYMPPMMVFPRKRIDPQLMLNAASGSWRVCSDSGWTTTEIFSGWFKKFVEFCGTTIKRPVLLLLEH